MKQTVPAALLLLLLACAKMVAPGGGPEDRTPPEIVSIDPSPGAGYQGLEEIELKWSERLEEASVTVFIYPPVPYRLDVSGSSVKIALDHPVGSEPMVIHLPGVISDRRGNQWGESMDLVYSASDSLPSASVTVAMARQGGGNLSSHTILEVYREQDLVRRTEPDSSGIAVVRWLEPDTYRILTYEDPDRSFVWDSQTEAGFDTVLAVSDSLVLDAMLTVVDTIGPILTDVVSLDGYHVQMTFNEEVSYASFGMGTVTLSDTTGEDVVVNGSWIPGGYSDRNVVIETAELPDSLIILRLEGIEDLMGNPSSADSMEFYGSDSLPGDSLRIRSFYPAPGTDNADPGGPFRISFSFWVDPDTLSEKLTLMRVADSTYVTGTLVVVDGRSFEYYPEHQLIGEQHYRFELEPGIGTLWGDTLSAPFGWSFSTLWGDEPGSLSGTVTGTYSPDLKLQISRTGGGGDDSIIYADITRGDYTVHEIPAGRYTVAAFVDTDGGGTWSPMEPYGTYPGVVLVQPGLITRDVDIEILP